VFRGQHCHTMDGKGRLSIPAKFRETLESTFSAPLFVTVLESCLVAYPADEWRILEAELLSRSNFDKAIRKFKRVFYAPAQECTLDKAGRILLPPALRERIDLGREVVLSGMGKTFEIWDAKAHEAMMNKEVDDIGETLDSIGDIGL
jgi:MraZ protein